MCTEILRDAVFFAVWTEKLQMFNRVLPYALTPPLSHLAVTSALGEFSIMYQQNVSSGGLKPRYPGKKQQIGKL